MIDYDLISRSKDLLTGCPFGNALGRGVSMLYVKELPRDQKDYERVMDQEI